MELGNGESLWSRVAGLALVIEECEYERLHCVLAHEFERITTQVRLVGAGVDGLGEDVSVFREDGTTLHEARPPLPLAGEWTLPGFSEQLAPHAPRSRPPQALPAARYSRRDLQQTADEIRNCQSSPSRHDARCLEDMSER